MSHSTFLFSALHCKSPACRRGEPKVTICICSLDILHFPNMHVAFFAFITAWIPFQLLLQSSCWSKCLHLAANGLVSHLLSGQCLIIYPSFSVWIISLHCCRGKPRVIICICFLDNLMFSENFCALADLNPLFRSSSFLSAASDGWDELLNCLFEANFSRNPSFSSPFSWVYSLIISMPLVVQLIKYLIEEYFFYFTISCV